MKRYEPRNRLVTMQSLVSRFCFTIYIMLHIYHEMKIIFLGTDRMKALIMHSCIVFPHDDSTLNYTACRSNMLTRNGLNSHSSARIHCCEFIKYLQIASDKHESKYSKNIIILFSLIPTALYKLYDNMH